MLIEKFRARNKYYKDLKNQSESVLHQGSYFVPKHLKGYYNGVRRATPHLIDAYEAANRESEMDKIAKA